MCLHTPFFRKLGIIQKSPELCGGFVFKPGNFEKGGCKSRDFVTDDDGSLDIVNKGKAVKDIVTIGNNSFILTRKLKKVILMLILTED